MMAFGLLLLMLLSGSVISKGGGGSNEQNKIFTECAVKLRDGNGPETIISHISAERLRALGKAGEKTEKDKAIYFSLGGHLLLGNGDLASECEQEKGFQRANIALRRIESLGGCTSETGTLRYKLRTGTEESELKLGKSKNPRSNKCFAQTKNANYEIHQCQRSVCTGDRLFFVKKKWLPLMKEFVVEEVLVAELTEQNRECIEKACPKALPQVEQIVHKVPKSEKKTQKTKKGHSEQNKLFLECVVKRSKKDLETVVAHIPLGRQQGMQNRTLFISLAGHFYLGDASVAKLCNEDKSFSDYSVALKNRVLTGCSPEKLEYREGPSQAKSSLKLVDAKKSRRTNKGSECRVESTVGVYDLYECKKEVCGKAKLLILNKGVRRENRNNALVIGGKVMVQDLTFMDATEKELECVRRSCSTLPLVESVVERKQQKSTVKKPGQEHCVHVVGHAKLDAQHNIFFDTAGRVYAGEEGQLGSECKEKRKEVQVQVKNIAKVEYCSKFETADEESVSIRRFGLKTEAQRQQCRAYPDTGAYNLYQCAKAVCGGSEDKVLLLHNTENRVVKKQAVDVREVLVVDRAKLADCLRAKCKGVALTSVLKANKIAENNRKAPIAGEAQQKTAEKAGEGEAKRDETDKAKN